MANMFITNTSRFKPFSFQEMLQPYQMYTDVYNKTEEELSNLDIMAGDVASKLNNPLDEGLKKQYQEFQDELNTAMNDLYDKGLTSNVKRHLSNLKSKYTKNLKPINEAYKAYQTDQQYLAKMAIEHPEIIISGTGKSVSDYIGGKTPQMKALDLNTVSKTTSQMAKNIASTILSDPEYTSIFENQYVQQKIKQGFDLSQIIAAAQRDPDAPSELLGIVDTVKQQFNYNSWDDISKSKIDAYINEGLTSAIGTPKIDVMSDRSYMTDIEAERLELANSLVREQIEQLQGEEIPGGGKVVKLGGGKYIEYDKEGNIVRTNTGNSPLTPQQKEEVEEQKEINKALRSVVKVSDMKGIGYTPVGAVIKSNGEWVGGREGEDIPGSWKGVVRTNLKKESAGWHRFYDPMSWFTGSGDFSYSPYDSSTEASVVTNPETIPGFLEYLNGAEDITNTAFGKILEQATKAGISMEEFDTDNIQIVKVKAKGNRVSSDEPYDYLIYRKS